MPGFFIGKGVGVGFGVGCGFGLGWGFGGAPLHKYGLGVGGGCGVGFGLGWGMGVGWGSKIIEPQVFPAKTEPTDFLHAAQQALDVLRDDRNPQRGALQAAGAGGAVGKGGKAS